METAGFHKLEEMLWGAGAQAAAFDESLVQRLDSLEGLVICARCAAKHSPSPDPLLSIVSPAVAIK
jgi:hypothetical protein